MRAHNGVPAGRSGHQMEVVVEPIRRAVERIAATHGDVTAIRRVAGLKPG